MIKVIRYPIFILLPMAIVFFIHQFGFTINIVHGSSMQPTLYHGDGLLVNKWKFLFDSPKEGEVITFEDPSQKGRFLVKRVIGVPGDTIEIKNGLLYRNGTLVHEPFVQTIIEDGDFGPIRVRENTVFVMGDNRHHLASRDSRDQSVGLVPFDLIRGKVEVILWRTNLTPQL